MQITRLDPFSQKKTTLDIPCTEAQYAAWEAGEAVQRAFPGLSADHREFILTGIAPESWDKTFPPEAQ